MTTHHITPIPASVGRGSVLEAAIRRADDQYRVLNGRIDALLRPASDARDFEGARDLGELMERALKDRDLVRRAWAPAYLERQVADEVTADNAGVLPPSWLLDHITSHAAARPAITAFGGPRKPAPEGLTVTFPVRSTTASSVGVQASEKTEATSEAVKFSQGEAPFVTYAGTADIALQLHSRSPAFRQAYAVATMMDSARQTEAAFCAALVAGGTAAAAGWDADATGESLLEALLAASSEVEDATGMPASFAIAAADVFDQLPRLARVYGPGTEGGPGRVEVPGLGPVIRSRGLATGQVIVSNPSAAGWLEDGPFAAQEVQPAKVGMDVAFMTLGAAAIFVPSGVVKLYGPGASGS